MAVFDSLGAGIVLTTEDAATAEVCIIAAVSGVGTAFETDAVVFGTVGAAAAAAAAAAATMLSSAASASK